MACCRGNCVGSERGQVLGRACVIDHDVHICDQARWYLRHCAWIVIDEDAPGLCCDEIVGLVGDVVRRVDEREASDFTRSADAVGVCRITGDTGTTRHSRLSTCLVVEPDGISLGWT